MKYSNEFTMFAGLKGQDAAILDQWLDQYQLRKELFAQDDSLEDEFEPYTEENLKKIRDAVSEFDSDLSVGQIRLWSSEMVEDKDIPPYFAILAELKDDKYLTVPFSSLPLPADEGEMATSLDIPFCEVLQCWNAQAVPACLVKRSWLAGEMPQETTMAANALYSNLNKGEALPENFNYLRGGAILNPFDPRISYFEESKEQFSPLLQKIKQIDLFIKNLIFFAPQEEEYALAAADKTEDTIVREYTAEGYSCEIALFLKSDDSVDISVSTDELEEFTIRNRDGEILAEIKDFEASISNKALGGAMVIADKSGSPIVLKEKQD